MNSLNLFAAARIGETDQVRACLDADPGMAHVRNSRATVDGSPEWNEITLLHTAAKFGHLELVKLLVDRGAEVYSNPLSTYPAVIVADWEKRQAVVDYFLKDIPDKANGTFGIGVTCNLAGRQGWAELVARHIAIDPLVVHQRGWIGDTPLHWPAHNGYVEIVRMLLAAGADANAHEIGWIGGTPLHWASERNPEIIRLLVSAGADPNAVVRKAGSHHLGGTPLHWCARQCDDSAEAARTLLEVGTRRDTLDSFGKTALEWARELGHQRVAAVLA